MRILRRQRELPKLTEKQLDVLRQFAEMEVGIDEVRRALQGAFAFDFSGNPRTAETHFQIPVPGVPVTREHVARAIRKELDGQVTRAELVFWAAMILLNDAYQFDLADEDRIAESLNDISSDIR